MNSLLYAAVELLPPSVVLSVAVKSAILMTIILAIRRLLHSASALLRSAVLRAGIAAILLLAIVLPQVPQLEIPLPERLNTTAVIQLSGIRAGENSSSGPSTSAVVYLSLVTVWILGVAVVSIRPLRGQFALRRIKRNAKAVESSEMLAQANVVMRSLNMGRRPNLLLSSDLQVPVAGGIFRPFVILPTDAANWSRTRIAMVLRHELTHHKRRDILWLWLATLLVNLHWFNPLAWRIKKRLLLESEYICDGHVVASGIDDAVYARHLLEWAKTTSTSNNRSLSNVAPAYDNFLEDRIMSVFNEQNRQSRLASWVPAGLGIIALVTVATFAGLSVKGCSNSENGASLTNGSAQQMPAPDEFVAVDAVPQLTKKGEVVYPEEEKNNAVGGTVWVRALVDVDGNVVDAIAEGSSGNVNLDQAAIDAAPKNKFTPAMKDGQPVAVWVTYSVDFVPGDKTESAD